MFEKCIDKRKYVRYNCNIKNKCSERKFEQKTGGTYMNTATYPITNRDLLNIRRKLRRQRTLRRRIVFTTLAIFITLIFTFSYNVLVTQANDDMSDVKYKYYTYHEVEKGETLWSIAENYIDYDYYESISDYIKELRVMNHLNDDLIKAGEDIVVTYYSGEYY